ncbi:MAG: beta-glucuronidase [Thermoleophilaceae bacterium]|nr:beta-glucuronidase [Thermoleophilaceae bacterium]
MSTLLPPVRRGTLTFLLACLLALCAAGPAVAAGKPWYQDGPGGRILLDGQWLFRADPADEGLAGGWAGQTDTAGWSATTVPNAWNAGDDSDASMAGGVGWYRRDLHVPAKPPGALWIARFESVNYRATVFLNGVQIAQHEAASIPFEVPLANLQTGVNRLVIRVDSRRGGTDLPPGPGGGWWNYGGILREVYLRPVTQLDISELLTRTIGPDELLVRATLTNPGGGLKRGLVTATVAGRQVRLGSVRVPSGGSRDVSQHVRIGGATPWEPGHAALYEVKAVASVRGKDVASYTVHTGLRRLAVRSDGRLTVNGFPANLRGASIHEQTPARGAALTPADHAREITELRDLGAWLTRSHYPLSEDFLERADRAGIFVWEEIPFYQLAESAMRDPAVRQKGLDYLAAAIKRDQNHPSVIAWSIGNELPATPGRGQRAYIRDAVALAHRLDPTRPVAMAFAGYPTKNYIPAFAPLDALGVNDYFGWYPGPIGQIVNRGALGQFLDRLHANYPRKALFVTEFGAEANRAGPRDEKGTYDFQKEFMRFHLATYAKRPWLSGAINWVLQDFKVRPQWTGGNPLPDSPWLRKGLIDQNGAKKPAYGPTRRTYRRTKPLVKP